MTGGGGRKKIAAVLGGTEKVEGMNNPALKDPLMTEANALPKRGRIDEAQKLENCEYSEGGSDAVTRFSRPKSCQVRLQNFTKNYPE